VAEVSAKKSAELPPVGEPLPAPVPDSHTHLDMVQSAVGVGMTEAMDRARSVRIDPVVTVGTDVATSEWSVEAAQRHPSVYAAVAVHPNETTGVTDTDLDRIAELARRPRVRAVGETGLDHYRDWAPASDQERSFRAHIAIAKASGRALMIHDREAHDDVLRILEEEGPPPLVVFHCFSGDADMARLCADRGYVMSFAGNLTFSSAHPLREAARVAPAELILVETDAPFLTPAPFRGRPNAPDLAAVTLRALAELKQIDLLDLCHTVAANAERTLGPW